MSRLAVLSAYYLLIRHKWCLDSLATVSAKDRELARELTLKLPIGFDPYEVLSIVAAACPELTIVAKANGGKSLLEEVEAYLFDRDEDDDVGELASSQALMPHHQAAQELFLRHGWVVQCESPLELSNDESQGFIRGNEAAEALLAALMEEEAKKSL